ncbi:hypothetical protein Q0Z83_035850 [Actinoplanes sichuanensis]|uniref:Uncharacterized protein n=1 Tax=Actinoplanes sichuanensis TaxID=512349 RepID=A0ABW4ABK0_9ACTN|nr:hypothetical protein [Actinoplanes sichuanensis]BEL05394.1 hypothetical protein Q0Z83_035850 [Actinoplanes sichuanensis]
MATDRRLALHARLPERHTHLEVLASTIDHRGRMLALVTDPSPTAPYDAVVLTCDGDEVHETALRGLDLRFNLIDALGDGFVLGSARCGPSGVSHERHGEPVPDDELDLTRNVRVINGRGEVEAAFYVGDAIGQLLTDRHDGIWISYFDESNYWQPNGDGTRSYAFMIGLARWDRTGGDPWMVPLSTPGLTWCDCYALNVGRDLVHACPYVDFPLVELDAREVRSVTTENPVTRCHGLAVDGAELAFLDQRRTGSGYRWEIRRAVREGPAVVETGRERLLLPDGRSPSSWSYGRIGRDAALWLQAAGEPHCWYRYDM